MRSPWVQPRRSPYLLFRFFCELYLFQMPSVGILFQTNWKMFLVSILCLNNMPEFTACQEKRGSSSAFRTVCSGLPAASPSQAESCGVSSLQDKPTFPFYRKPNHLNNKSVDAELASWNRMAVLSFPELVVVFLLFLSRVGLRSHMVSLLCSLLCCLR